ncbi:MAG: hypothetical protein R3E65_10470 [Steroidobacteraceae bacterium]
MGVGLGGQRARGKRERDRGDIPGDPHGRLSVPRQRAVPAS